MFQFPGFAPLWVTNLQLVGFTYSEIFGSKIICISPKLIAAYHVLHRRRMPRHPPCALVHFQLHLRSARCHTGFAGGLAAVCVFPFAVPDSNTESRNSFRPCSVFILFSTRLMPCVLRHLAVLAFDACISQGI